MSSSIDSRDRAGIESDLASADEDVRHLAVERATLLSADEGLPLLVDQLGDSSWRVRKAVVEGIVASPDVARATSALIAALSDAENPGRRNSAVEALVAVGSDTLPALVIAATDADADVRKFAVDTLAGIGDRRATESLLYALTDDDANVRAAAADALAATGGESAGTALLACAVDPGEDLTVRFSALRALGELQHPVHSSALVEVLEDPVLGAAGLVLLGRAGADKGAIEILLKELQSNSRAHREGAIGGLLRVLGSRDIAEDFDIVRQIGERVEPDGVLLGDAIERLFDADPGTRLRLLQFLGLIELEQVVIPILRCARERDFADAAIATLVHLGATAESAIDKAWESLDTAARRDACDVFASTGGEAAATRLVASISDVDPAVRFAAAEAIGRSRLTMALEALMNRVQDVACRGNIDAEEEGSILIAAIVALVGDAPPSDATRAVVGARLRDWLAGAKDLLRLVVAKLLAGIGRDDDAELITLLLRDPSARVRRAAVDAAVRLEPAVAMEALHLALVDDAPRVRMAAVMALGASEAASASDDLARLVDDEDAWVRAAAVRALGARCTVSEAQEDRELVFAVLERALNDEVLVALGAVEALQGIGGPSALRVLPLLDRKEPELVTGAIGCLEAHAPIAELDALLPLVEHPEWSVRAEATRVLGTRSVVRALPAILARVHVEQDEFVREMVLATLARLEA